MRPTQNWKWSHLDEFAAPKSCRASAWKTQQSGCISSQSTHAIQKSRVSRTCSQIRHVNSNLRLSDSPSGFIMILWRDAYSFIAIKQSLWVILKLVLWLVNALKMQQCCKANCHCFPFSQALITPQCRAETTGLLSRRINETILTWSCRMWSYHGQHHEPPICCVHAEP